MLAFDITTILAPLRISCVPILLQLRKGRSDVFFFFLFSRITIGTELKRKVKDFGRLEERV